MTCASPLIIALDLSESKHALHLAEQLNPEWCRLKVGLELFTKGGPSIVELLQKKGFDIFLDLKFHDIPNTTAQACKSALELGVWMLNVHALGGERMLKAAAEVCAVSIHKTILVAVTILTSHDENELTPLGFTADTSSQHTIRLAKLAFDAGCNGVVSSAKEVVEIKRTLGKNFITVTPGIRLANDSNNDQRRVMSPQSALSAGSDFLVIGRPITQAANPSSALQNLYEEITTCKSPL